VAPRGPKECDSEVFEHTRWIRLKSRYEVEFEAPEIKKPLDEESRTWSSIEAASPALPGEGQTKELGATAFDSITSVPRIPLSVWRWPSTAFSEEADGIYILLKTFPVGIFKTWEWIGIISKTVLAQTQQSLSPFVRENFCTHAVSCARHQPDHLQRAFTSPQNIGGCISQCVPAPSNVQPFLENRVCDVRNDRN
jgi:hypothetical protein